MNTINNLAKIARQYGITESGNLRDDIVSEYTDSIESLNTIDESVIDKDISLLPVYTINEGLFNKKSKNKNKETEVKKEPKPIDPSLLQDRGKVYKQAVSLVKTELNKYKILKKYVKFSTDFYNEFISGKYNNAIIFEFDLYDIYDNPRLEFKEEKNEKEIEIPESQLLKTVTSKLPNGYSLEDYGDWDDRVVVLVHTINESNIEEGYAIDLDSLKYVVESKEITLEEAIQEIRDVNYIGDTIPMYCVLPENINENIDLESFIILNNTLNESGINPIILREYSEEEFITEAGKIAEVVDKIKDKIRKMPVESLEKQIKTCEENNKNLKEELSKLDKMSSDDAKSYVKKQVSKNYVKMVGYYAASGASGGASGALLVYAPFLGAATFLGSMIGVIKIGSDMSSKGSTIIVGTPDKYKQAIRNTISLNNSTIASCKVAIKEKGNK